jgi:hypothetical protein
LLPDTNPFFEGIGPAPAQLGAIIFEPEQLLVNSFAKVRDHQHASQFQLVRQISQPLISILENFGQFSILIFFL